MRNKILLSFILVCVMVIGFAWSVSAATAGSAYFDRIWDGKTESGYGSSKVGLTATMVGGGVLIDKWKIGAEYGQGMNGDVGPKEITLWSIKGGYRVLDATATKLDVTLSHLNLDIDAAPFNPSLNGNLVGIDFTQFFSKQFFFSSTIQYSFDESYKFLGNSVSGDKFIRIVRGKFNYLFTDNIGATLGYSSLAYTVKNSFPYGAKNNLGGLTLGMIYKF